MQCYDKIDLHEIIGINKSNNSKENVICNYWFFNHGFLFQDSVCNGCHDLTMFCININNIAIIIVKDIKIYYSWH